jgi:hypothetical protein
VKDTDGDTLLDNVEVFTYFTDCANADTDFDGVNDNVEIDNGTDPVGIVAISIASPAPVIEPGNNKTTTVTLTVTLAKASPETVSVAYYTQDDTAVSGITGDYLASRGTLTFNPGVLTRTITITIRGDNLKEGTEKFYVVLTSPNNGYIPAGSDKATVTIVQ